MSNSEQLTRHGFLLEEDSVKGVYCQCKGPNNHCIILLQRKKKDGPSIVSGYNLR